MNSMFIQRQIQAAAPAGLRAVGKSSSLSTAGLKLGSGTPSLFAENGVIWGVAPGNVMYPAAFSSLTVLQSWAGKLISPWTEPFVPMPASCYATTPFSYQDYPCLAAGSNAWLYACTPTLAPLYMSALQSLGALPTSKAGPACKGIGSTCAALTANGIKNLPIAYLMLVPDTSSPQACMWDQGIYFTNF